MNVPAFAFTVRRIREERRKRKADRKRWDCHEEAWNTCYPFARGVTRLVFFFNLPVNNRFIGRITCSPFNGYSSCSSVTSINLLLPNLLFLIRVYIIFRWNSKIFFDQRTVERLRQFRNGITSFLYFVYRRDTRYSMFRIKSDRFPRKLVRNCHRDSRKPRQRREIKLATNAS